MELASRSCILHLNSFFDKNWFFSRSDSMQNYLLYRMGLFLSGIVQKELHTSVMVVNLGQISLRVVSIRICFLAWIGSRSVLIEYEIYPMLRMILISNRVTK